MCYFNFKVFFEELQKSGLKDEYNDLQLTNILFKSFFWNKVTPEEWEKDIICEEGFMKISKTQCTKIINGESGGNIPKVILNNLRDITKITNSEECFISKIIPFVYFEKEADLINNLSELVKNDYGHGKSEKSELLSFFADCDLEVLLPKVFFYSLRIDNVPRKKSKSSLCLHKDATNPNLQNRINFTIPDNINTDADKKYVKALLKAYGEDSHTEKFDIDDLGKNKDYKDDFNDQRRAFYAAVAVEEATHEVETNNSDAYFSRFLDEVYDCINEIYKKRTFANGYDRLREVLYCAANANTSACWLCKSTEWVGAIQKKGACHMLVDAGRLDGWVYKK